MPYENNEDDIIIDDRIEHPPQIEERDDYVEDLNDELNFDEDMEE